MSTAPNNHARVEPSHSVLHSVHGLPGDLLSQQKALTNARHRTSQPDAPIIVHCHLRWDFVWQRPQQIFSRLASHHRILFLEDGMDGEGLPRLEITQPLRGVVRVVPVIPGCEAMCVDRVSASILALLQKAMLSHPLLKDQFGSPIQWFYSPMTAPCFLGKLGAVAVVYDCMDELANFRFAPADISARERYLLARADLVFTGGYQLFRAKSTLHRNTHFFGCGVDVAHFGKARLGGTQVPPEIARLPRPVLGYFGVIDERLDYALLARLAASEPDASVVMVGPFAKVEPASLPQAKNIHWMGPRPYSDLPAVVKGFDICLMPFAMNAATQYINPTKTLEYMASGKPVVSTAVPDVVRNFTPVVQIGFSHDAFIAAVRQALTRPDPLSIEEGLARASAASWDQMVASMRALMLQPAPPKALAEPAQALSIAIEPAIALRGAHSGRQSQWTAGRAASAVRSDPMEDGNRA